MVIRRLAMILILTLLWSSVASAAVQKGSQWVRTNSRVVRSPYGFLPRASSDPYVRIMVNEGLESEVDSRTTVYGHYKSTYKFKVPDQKRIIQFVSVAVTYMPPGSPFIGQYVKYLMVYSDEEGSEDYGLLKCKRPFTTEADSCGHQFADFYQIPELAEPLDHFFQIQIDQVNIANTLSLVVSDEDQTRNKLVAFVLTADKLTLRLYGPGHYRDTEMRVAPRIEFGEFMIPVYALAYIGSQVTFDLDAMTCTVKFPIGDSITYTFGGRQAVLQSGRVIELPVAPYMLNQTMYVPIEGFSTDLCDVSWMKSLDQALFVCGY